MGHTLAVGQLRLVSEITWESEHWFCRSASAGAGISTAAFNPSGVVYSQLKDVV